MARLTNDLLMYLDDEGSRTEDVVDTLYDYADLRVSQRDVARWLARAELDGLVTQEILPAPGGDLQLWSLTGKGERMTRRGSTGPTGQELRRRLVRVAAGGTPDIRQALLGLLVPTSDSAGKQGSTGREAALGSVGKTILDQMGGYRRLSMMLGIQQVMNLRNGVGFKWPNKQRSKGNYVEIELTGADLYDMTFYNLSMRGKKRVKEYRGLYADMLVSMFEKQTGWYLRM